MNKQNALNLVVFELNASGPMDFKSLEEVLSVNNLKDYLDSVLDDLFAVESIKYNQVTDCYSLK